MAGQQQSDELTLFEHLRHHRDDPAAYYQIATRFYQLGQPFIARPFYQRAQTLLGDRQDELAQVVSVELAQIHMDLGNYQASIDAFHQLNDAYGSLPIQLVLKMAECYALMRQLDEADAVMDIVTEEALTQVPGLATWYEEIGDEIARVHDFDEQEEDLNLRQWHYVQTRSMLLETNPDENMPGERFIFFTPSGEDVAYLTALTAAILDQKGYAPTKILWLGERSEPLAHLFAQWWEVEEENLRPYRHGDNTDNEEELALLVMAHSDDIMNLQSQEEFADLMQARAGLITFALDVRWTEQQPMCPDITGYLAQVSYLPWEVQMVQQGDQVQFVPLAERPDPRKVAEELAQFFPEEEESDRFARETLEEFADCSDLILDHRDGDLARRSLLTHSPIASPRLM